MSYQWYVGTAGPPPGNVWVGGAWTTEVLGGGPLQTESVEWLCARRKKLTAEIDIIDRMLSVAK